MSRYLLISTLLLCSVQSVLAIKEEFGTRVLVQPDGTQFTVREFADEFGHYLSTPNGYVVKDPSNGYYHYLRYDSAGRKSPSSVRAGIDDGSSSMTRLKQENEKALKAWRRQEEADLVSRSAGVAGSASAVDLPDSLIVILVEFSDVKHQNSDDWPMMPIETFGERKTNGYPEYTVSDFDSMLFGANYTDRSPDGETLYGGSMRQYWEDMSRRDDTVYTLKGRVANQFDPETNIPTWVILGDTKINFHANSQEHFRRTALDSAVSQQGIDVSVNKKRKICIIYAGNMYVSKNPDYPTGGLNPHYSHLGIYIMSERWAHPDPPLNPRNTERNNANFSHIGVHCHEFGHILGLDDMYSTDNPDEMHNRDYHKWGLMADGGNKKVSRRGDNPAPLTPHFRAELGWINPDKNKVDGLTNVTLSYSSAMDDVYKIGDGNDFFLVENRQTGTGWNQALDADNIGGLLIWHIRDESGRYGDYIDLVEADTSNVDDRLSYYGDLFPGSTVTTALTDFTVHSNSRRWGSSYDPDNPGGNSSVRIFNISDSGTNMTATLGPFWVGSISQGMNEWKNDIVKVGGDVTIPSGVTLTLAAGTEVHFLADQDDAMSGSDSGKAELIVDGVLEAGAGNIFRSSNDDPSDPEWYGIYLRGQGQANLTNATLRDGVACVPVSGNGAFSLMGATLDDCGLITGSDSVPFPENGTNVATYLTTGRMGSSVSWDLEGDDAYDFNISSGQLSFDMPPDFESPMDDDEKNTYDVIVVARGGQLTATKEVTVTVEDLFEPEVPLPPGDLSAESGWTRVHVEWLPVPMVSGYDVRMQRKFVYYGPPNSWPDEWEVVAENEVGEAAADSRLLYTHSDLNPDYTYRYQVRSRLNEETVSLWSDIFPGGEGVQPRPGAATGLQGEPGSSSVPLRWDRLNLTNITRWEYRAGTQMGTNIEWGSWKDIGGGPGTTEHRVDELVNGTAYTFQVRAFNQAGDGEPSAASEFVTPQLTLIISGTSDTTFVENSQNIVDTYTTTAPVTWSLGGVDADRLSIDADGHLRFPTPPDFEMPTDADGNNIYHVRVRARSGGEIVREESPPVFVKEVTVEVLNADDPGVVTLSSTQPEVGEPITATLTDQDGLVEDVDVRWSWLYFSSEDGSRNGEPTVVASSDELIPSGVLMGLRLQARALYDDEFGTHSAESVQTEPVVGRPSAPQNLTATPSDGSLVLAWDAPSLAGYPAFSGYRYRYKTTKGTAWQPSATGALVDQTTRPTLEEGLIHGKEHTIEVWAVNAQGAGPAATTTATPLSPDTPGRVELTSRRPRVGVPLTATLVDPDAPVRVRRWRWLQSPWYHRSAGDLSLVAPSEARYPEQASYEPTVSALGRRLRAVVDYTDQYGTPSAQSAWTAPVEPGWPGSPELSYVAGDEQVALTWTAAADHGAAIIRYQYHRSDKSGTWLDVPDGGLDSRYTVEGLHNDTDYTFKVRAVNNVGSGSPSNAVTATPQGPADPNPNALVTLPDDDDPAGVVSLSSPSPQEDSQLTATLSDASGGISSATWQWQRRQGSLPWTNAAGTSLELHPWISIYTPQSGDVGHLLRATVIYTDADGPNQRAESTATDAVRPTVETQYAYRAWQTAPLFDAVASGPPDNWSSSEIPWTDAAPRVWSIQRTRPSGGTWSEWGTLKKHSERPAASETFYRRASSAPSTPGTQTGTTLSTPSTWQTTQPTATATESVWSTTANRAAGDRQWIFTAPTQETPITSVSAPGPVRNLSAEGGSVSGSIAVSWDAPNTGGTPDRYRVESRQGSAAWQAGGTTTQTSLSIGDLVGGSNYSIQVRAENSGGNSRWRSTPATATNGTETESAYRLHTSGTTAPTFSASASSVPSGWSSSRQTPTSTYAPYEWQISRTRPTDGSWSSWGSATVFSTYTERQTAYRLHISGTMAPTFSASASSVPSGWSSSRQTPTSTYAPYEWQISRTRPTDGSWSSWGSATVFSTYTERQTAYRLHISGTMAPTFSASASSVPSGWSSSRQTPTSTYAPYEWQISRTRPTDGSWSSWGSATVVSTYTETQTAYRLNNLGSNPPTFSTTASGVPSGWSSSRLTPSSSNRYEWRISRTRPTDGSWSNWGSITVVSTYTETQTAYRLNNLGSNPPTFSASASGVPSGWSSSRQTPSSSNRYEWRISRTRPTDGSWSNWGSITVFSTYTETQTAYRLHISGTTAPTFSASASSVPSGWSSSRQTPTSSSNRYEWQISRTRPTSGSWSNWGSATVVSTYTETQTAYRLNNLGSNPPTFSASASSVPTGWSLLRQTPSSSNRYEWRISRTRPTDGSWSNWGSRTVVSTYTETQTAYRLNNLGSNPPTFSASASGVPSGWSSSRQTPSSSNRYEWRISRTRPTDGSWSNWGSRTVVSTYTETQTAYRLNNLGSNPPTFSASASGVPSGWSSSRQTPSSSNRYEWRISRTRPTDGSWSNWGSRTVVSTYTETQTAYRLHISGTTAPTFSASASSVPTGWSSSRQTPTSAYAPYEWQISRTRPTDGSWSSWGSATVVSTYTERQTAYRLNNLGSNPPTFSTSASGVPSGWSSSRQTPSSSNRYEWRISRTRPTDGSWSNWGSASVVSTYTETQTAYRLNNLGSNPPTFSASASGVPSGWSSSRQTPSSSNRYEWRISRTRPTDGSWSNWGSITVVSTYTERQSAYRLNNLGSSPPTFSATASGVPSGWSSSRLTPSSSNRYEWRISRTRPTGGSWSNWGSASVVSTYTERQSAYRRNNSSATPPAFSTTVSGVPYGWSSSRQTPSSSNRYEWRISRTRPTDGSWSSWGRATVVSTYTETQTAYRLHTSGTTAPTFTASASSVPTGWSSTRPTPDPYAPYVWQISRTRTSVGSWSNWGRATVVSTYTASASRVPTGWYSSRPTPNPHARYAWRISRTRPAVGSWSNGGSG